MGISLALLIVITAFVVVTPAGTWTQPTSQTTLTAPYHHMKIILSAQAGAVSGCSTMTVYTPYTFSKTTGNGSIHLRSDSPACLNRTPYSSVYPVGEVVVKIPIIAPPTGHDTIVFNMTLHLQLGWNVSIPQCTRKTGSTSGFRCDEFASYSMSAGSSLTSRTPFLGKVPQNFSSIILWKNATANYSGRGGGPIGGSGGGYWTYRCPHSGSCTTTQSPILGGSFNSNYSVIWTLSADLNSSRNYTAGFLFNLQLSSESQHSASATMVGGAVYADEGFAFKLKSITIP